MRKLSIFLLLVLLVTDSFAFDQIHRDLRAQNRGILNHSAGESCLSKAIGGLILRLNFALGRDLQNEANLPPPGPSISQIVNNLIFRLSLALGRNLQLEELQDDGISGLNLRPRPRPTLSEMVNEAILRLNLPLLPS